MSKSILLSEVDMTFCKGRPIGYYPDVKDCKSVYHCVNGITYWRHCPEGLHFNPVIRVCDWPKNVQCTIVGQQDKQMRCPQGVSRISQILKNSKCLERKSEEGVMN